ncbi:MAG TPA: DUF2610 domain-containing protein [Gemmataceae bacterium]|nr:DUF2610 domain-containing protein [Gemmataceae bacterium]
MTAQPPSFRYLAGKFARRYRVPLAAAALVLFLLGVGTLLAFLRIRSERNDAIEARHNEEKEKDRAQQTLGDLQRSRKEAEVVWNVVDQAYTAVKEDKIRHLPGLSPVHEELARIRLEGMQQLAKATPDDPTVEPKVARARAILGMISTYVGSFHRAEENLERAAQLYGQLTEKHPDSSEYRLQQCRALLDLGWLYWDDNRKPAARRVVEQTIKRLEPEYARAPSDPEVCYELGRGLALLGGCLPNDATQETREKLATRAIRLFEQLIEQKHREVDSRTGLAVATYRLTMARFDGKDQQGLLKSLDEISVLDEAALKLEPASPYLKSFAVFMHHDRADALVRLGKPKEALVEREAAVAKSREIVKRSPDAGQYTSLLAAALNKLGSDLPRLQRAADAQAAFEESNQIMDGLVRRFPDRAFLASQWLDCRNDLADLFEYGPNANGQIQARQDLQRTLDQAVQRGREFAARFPDHYWLQYNFAKSLAARGRYDNNAKRYEQALPYLLEAADVYRTRLIAAKNPPDADDVATYLSQLQLATSCSGFAGKSDEVNRLSQLALQVRKHCTSRAAVDDLGTILAEAAKFHREAGRNAEAIRTYQDAIDARSPAFEQATWHWYLRAHIGSSYEALADIYRQTGDFRNEVLANREYLKMIVRPWYGAKIEEYIDPSRPADEAEAIRIRELIKQATSTGMQHFTIPCDFSGIKYPFYVYVTNVPWPKHPLEDQARWLKEEKRGTIPEETMKEFGRLHKIAHENDVSFVDLCVYALGRARAEEGKQLEIENIGEPSTVVGSLETPGKAARDAVANLKARLVDLKTKLDNAPGDLIAAREAALLYEELGQRLLKAGRPRDGVEPLRESARLRELQVRAQPTATQPRQLLAATFLLLGKAHVQLKEFDTAYNCFHRRLDLLEQLQLNVPTPEQHSAIAANLMLFGELAELRGDQSEALRWYIQGLQEKNREAAARIANLLAIDATLAAGLTSDLQVVYARLKEEGSPKNPLTFVSDFAKEVETVQKAREALAALGSETGIDQKERLRWLADFAESYRTLAAGCLKQSQGEEALKACLREIELRHLILRLDSADQQVKDNYVRALLDGAKVSITLGQTSDGLKLLERGRQLGDENATFFLADLYTQGKVVTRDPEKATAIRSEFTFNKGRRLWDQKKYSQALVEFERSVKDKPSIDGYQRVGWCQRRLGRNEEAVAAFKKGIDLATVLNNCQSVVLDLVEAALSANKPAEVFAVLRMLEEKKWSAEGTDTPYTFERELTGMRAIALLMADKDASAAEKKLEEIVSRPNLSSLRSRNVELDAWLKGSRPSDARQAAVRKILATLGAPARELVSPYFPLKQGRTWVYTSSTGAEITVLKAARPAQAAERKYWLVETMVNGKVTESEQIAIELDGVYRQSSTPSLLKSNVRVLPLPARGGDSWVIKSRTGLRAGVNGQGATRVEDVTVPAGEFKGAIVAEMKTQDASGKSTQIVWYAKDVGPVKVVTKTKNGTLTWELKKVVIVFYQFDKSGKVKAPTAAELQVADADSFILGFVHGTMEDGRPYWAYVAIKPSKYREFYDATSERRPMVIGDYGKVVRAGFDKEVPADAKKEMEEKYGFDENYEENLKKEAKQDQELFLEQQEAKHIAAIVDMLKKKQGR